MNQRITFLGLCMLVSIFLPGCAGSQTDTYYLLVGTYTGEGSEGIYRYRFDRENGSLDPLGLAARLENPSYMAVTGNGDHVYVYAVSEQADAAEAALSAFSVDRTTGKLQLLNERCSGGGEPCYVSVNDEDATAFVANYLGGSFSRIPIAADGSLGPAVATAQRKGHSVNENRQEASHVHAAVVTPDSAHVIITDLGTDQVAVYKTGGDSLDRTPISFFNTAKGAGPRHLVFHPNHRFAYLANELNGTVVVFKWEDHRLRELQTISTLPEGYEGPATTADLHVSPDGRFLYVTNREQLNDIVIYAIDEATGMLRAIGRQQTGGVHPRNFMIDPSGKYLLAANRYSDTIVVFRRDKATGLLTPTGTEAVVSQPVSLVMVPGG